jgi:hypothetical protein
MAVNDLVQVNAVQTIFNQTVLNSFWYYAFSGPGSVTSLLHQVNTAVITPWVAAVTSDVTFVRLDGAKVFPLPRAFTVSLSLAHAGTGAPPTVPINAAMTFTKQTAFAGRKYRGRWFISGFAQATVTNGQVSAAALATFQSLANAFAEDLTDSDGTVWNTVLLHGRIPTTGSPSYTSITAARANPIIRNQRRRQIGVGI